MASFRFRIKTTVEGLAARTGIISTPHGKILTPCFVPCATQAAVKGLTPAQAEDTGSQILMVNTYHTFLRPGIEVIRKFGGLHKFMGWNKPIMTDSGGFQVMSLGKQGQATVHDEHTIFHSGHNNLKHTFTPELSIQLQEVLGADITFAFDECTPLDFSRAQTEESLLRTHSWAERSLAAKTRKDQALYGIVQGGRFKELREKSAEFIAARKFQGFGIGSLFGEPKREFRDVLRWSMSGLPKDKPVHLLGIGAVEDLFTGVAAGVDTFDCVTPTRYGRLGYVLSSACGNKQKWRYRITKQGFKDDTKPLDKNCECTVCKMWSRAYIHHLFRANELLAYTLTSYHNIYFLHELMQNMRGAIECGTFSKLRKQWMG